MIYELQKLIAQCQADDAAGMVRALRSDLILPLLLEADEDRQRLDFLQEEKLAEFTPLNPKREIAAIGLFTVRSQIVKGNTVREVIDKARGKA